jgi:beta-lactamase superfamily II metal-dependent hydrolase
MLDVGQGESVFLRTPDNHKIIFDGGPDDSILSQLGSLLSPWDRVIDLVILSHNHSDHFDGLINLLHRYKVHRLWMPGPTYSGGDWEAFQSEIRQNNIPVTYPYFNSQNCPTNAKACPPIVFFHDLQLQVYHPLSLMLNRRLEDQHDADLVVKISFAQRAILLTGDLNEAHEQLILDTCKKLNCRLRANVFQVPHHGSKTGLLTAFLYASQPTVALIPVGKQNKFGHPDHTVLDKLKKFKVKVYRTDQDGRLKIIFTKNGTPTVESGP